MSEFIRSFRDNGNRQTGRDTLPQFVLASRTQDDRYDWFLIFSAVFSAYLILNRIPKRHIYYWIVIALGTAVLLL